MIKHLNHVTQVLLRKLQYLEQVVCHFCNSTNAANLRCKWILCTLIYLKFLFLWTLLIKFCSLKISNSRTQKIRILHKINCKFYNNKLLEIVRLHVITHWNLVLSFMLNSQNNLLSYIYTHTQRICLFTFILVVVVVVLRMTRSHKPPADSLRTSQTTTRSLR